MLCIDDIKIEFVCQGYKATHLAVSPDFSKTVLFLESQKSSEGIFCNECGGEAYIHENYNTHLIDAPLYYGTSHRLEFFGKRYKCNHTFTKEIPFSYPGTRITEHAATWIKGFLFNRKLLLRTDARYCFLLNKKIITPADLPCGHGDGEFENDAASRAAKPFS